MKKITHILAGIGGSIALFLLTPAGKAVLMQYPWITSIIAVLGALGLYHNPLKSGQ